ncbi:MAG: hypothetical protein IPL64_04305 [Flavobacteriales bacterium]|nr:hypothetical protein [Flavobacteriales bacterium]
MQTQKYSIQQPLFESLRSRVPDSAYPKEVMEDRSGRIKGPGFFPGSTGLVSGTKALASRPVMVLGQDQDNQQGHDRSEREKVKGELSSKTWTNMSATFKDAGIDLGGCFFTNFIMGVRVNSKRNTGASPGLRHPDFMQACSAFFIEQLKAQEPRVILCLGMVPFKLLSLVSSELCLQSIGIDSFKELDARKMNVIMDVQFDALPKQRFVVVPLTHPSYKLNSRNRVISKLDTVHTEIELLQHVKKHSLK